MNLRRIAISLAVAGTLGVSVFLGRIASLPRAAAEPTAKDAVAVRMADAATKLLDGLRLELRKKATFAYDDPARTQWHYYPVTPWPRLGAVLVDMKDAEKALVKALLRTGMSEEGYKVGLEVMALEGILRDIENTDWARKYRNPELYHVYVFGTPGPRGKWGWRIEGHHLVVSYAVEDGTIIGSTPFAVGANPGEVPSGPHKGLRILAREEDLGRKLYTLLEPSRRDRATLGATAPFDVMTEVKPQPRRLPMQGVPFAELKPKEKELLRQLLALHAAKFPEVVRDHHLKEIEDAGLDKLHFGWSGPAEPKEPHYYRIHGPTFVVEYCNTQNRANHIHCVWRSVKGDFGMRKPQMNTDEEGDQRR